ncbi:MAG TPA: DNA gyrase subunit A [Defluviitaleaceae bacterium]|nr:DNA gyrase subunit A [Candidatus Epulonipiscium sp.]HQD50630.1 DNA gyrase subunit A [Defluviitaleaceae bacterium]
MEEKELKKRIIPVEIEEEMRKSYIDYAMSVIVSRALPDVRDGLKPVHRRILYAMNELGLTPDKPHKKSARIVGETMGKYHPHGDSSIYDAMVRLAQDFSIRYPLVDGHGNFGSVDGDSPAAMRYTEARLSKIALELLADIEKDTIDYNPNFDESLKEPAVLPSRFPNLLVNGTSGIAVGMATNIPPHNLTEVINGVVKIIDNYVEENRETDIEELLPIIKGPDFPTGAVILGRRGIEEAYRTGKGKIKVRAVSEIESMSNNKQRIIVTEIPYMVNKAKLIEKIAELVKEKRIDGISDIRDESNREGMRIVIEIKKDYNANVVLNQLYKYTQLQDIFSVNMLALVNNEPKVLNLKDMLIHYLEHQKDVVTRRTQFDLRKAEERSHILEGLKIALDHIDEVISIIRSSQNTPEAKQRLIESFALSEQQAQAIVDMRLRTLTGLEREKIDEEYRELQETIKELKAILASEKRLYGVIKEELLIILQKYGDDRKTKFAHDDGEIDIEDLISDEQNVVTLTRLGYIKRLPLNTYRSQNRGGRGIIGMQTREEDILEELFVTSTHSYILFFTNKGKVYRLKTYEIPEASRTARGVAIVNLLQIDGDEKITAIIPVKEYKEGSYLLMLTKNGIIKKTSINEYENIRKSGLNAINLRENDELIQVINIADEDEIFIGTKFGQGILISGKEIRAIGRNATGVRAMNLNEGDEIVGAGLISEGKEILFVTEKGLGKRTDINEFKLQRRGGKGVKCYRLTEKTGKIIGIKMVSEDEEIMMITSEGIIIRMHVSQISKTGRVTQGVKLMNLSEDEKVVAVAKVVEE